MPTPENFKKLTEVGELAAEIRISAGHVLQYGSMRTSFDARSIDVAAGRIEQLITELRTQQVLDGLHAEDEESAA